MITTINEWLKTNENLLAAQGALNPPKNQVFTKSSLGPTFETELYAELKRLLPHGYTFDIKMWGNRNFLVITDIAGQSLKFPLGENTTVYKVKNMIRSKIALNESVTTDFNKLVDMWNEYLKLVDICDGILSENGELSDAYWKEGTEVELDRITNELGINNAHDIFKHRAEIIQNFNDLYDGLQGWNGAGNKNFGDINAINKNLFLNEAMSKSNQDENLVLTVWNSMTPENRIKTFNVATEQSVKTWMGVNSLGYLERQAILQRIGLNKQQELVEQKSVSIEETHNNENYVLEDIIFDFLAPYIKPAADYTLDSDNETVMLYIPATDVLFDITNIESPEFKILLDKFKEFCNANNLYDCDVTTTSNNTDLVFSADTDIIDVRNPRDRDYDLEDEVDENKINENIYIETWYNDGKSQLLGSDGTTVLKDNIGKAALSNAVKSHINSIKSLAVNVKPFLKDGFVVVRVVRDGNVTMHKKFTIE